MSEFPEAATIDPFLAVRSDHACFGCGNDNRIGLRLRFSAGGDGVRASFIPGPEHQGFYGVVHGGIITTVLDEAMAWAVAHAGVWAVTGDIRVRFRQPLNIGEQTTVTARLSGARGRVVNTAAEITLDRDRSPIATASAVFVGVDAEVEAAWRARYLRESRPVTAESSDTHLDGSKASDERNPASPPGD